MIKMIIAGTAFTVMLAACNNSTAKDEPYVNPDSLKAATITVPTPSANQQSAMQPQMPNVQPIVPANTAPAPIQAPATVTTAPMPAADVATAKGMNPAHGQPNHRCDIPVGAPLSTPIQKPASGQTTPAGQPVTINSVPPTKTAKGMNPPHGEPNHRCDIAVGAPLNSPVTKPATVTPTLTPVTVPAAEVVKDSIKG